MSARWRTACVDRCRSSTGDISSLPGAVLGLRDRILCRISCGLVGCIVVAGVIGCWKTLFTVRVIICEWWEVDICNVRLYARSNWRASSSAFSRGRKSWVPLRNNGGIVCLVAVKYRVTFQKEGFRGCNVRRKEFHLAFLNRWSLTRKIWDTMWARYRKMGIPSLWECRR